MSDMPPPPPDDSGWSSEPPPPPPGPSGPAGAPAAGLAALGTGETVQLATPGGRLGARIIDIIIVLIISFIAGLIEPYVVPFVAVAAYEIMFVAFKGQTPGKMATSIKIGQGRQRRPTQLGRLSRALGHTTRWVRLGNHPGPTGPRLAAVG